MAFESVPDTARQPQDHLPPAAQREAEGSTAPVTINWEGIDVELPAAVDDWDIDALDAMETGKLVAALRGLLGSKRYGQLRAEFEAKTGRKMKVGDLDPLFREIARVYGFTALGE